MSIESPIFKFDEPTVFTVGGLREIDILAKPFSNYNVVMTGGMTGIGAVTAERLSKLGANVHVGTHRPEGLKQFTGDYDPFLLDLEHLAKDAVLQADNQELMNIARLNQKIRQDPRPVVLIHSAAAGMENLFTDRQNGILKGILQLRRVGASELESQLNQVRQKIIDWKTPDVFEHAKKINSTGPIILTEKMNSVFPQGSWVVYLSSLWSTFDNDPRMEIPLFYKVVSETKQLYESWLREQAQPLREQGINVAIISGHLVQGTPTGNMLLDILSGLPESLRPKIDRSQLPFQEDMAAAVDLLLSDHLDIHPDQDGVYNLYVYKHGEVATGLSEKQYRELVEVNTHL